MGLEVINERKKQLHLTNEDLARLSGVPKTTIAKLTAGVTADPKLGTLKALARVLGCSLSDFDDEAAPPTLQQAAEQHFSSRFRKLDSHGRKLVEAVMDLELSRTQSAPERYIREYVSPAAAGAVSPVEGDDYITVKAPADMPDGADFAVRISGDSMEPFIRDGSRVFVSRRTGLQNGDIGIFFADGGIVCKQYCEDGVGGLYLLSLNMRRSDADIIIRGDSSQAVYCFGKVLTKRIPLPEF